MGYNLGGSGRRTRTKERGSSTPFSPGRKRFAGDRAHFRVRMIGRGRRGRGDRVWVSSLSFVLFNPFLRKLCGPLSTHYLLQRGSQLRGKRQNAFSKRPWRLEQTCSIWLAGDYLLATSELGKWTILPRWRRASYWLWEKQLPSGNCCCSSNETLWNFLFFILDEPWTMTVRVVDFSLVL